MGLEPHPSGPQDPFVRLQRKLDSLQKQVDTLRSGSRPTIPIYSASVIDELTQSGLNEGEIYIQDSNDNMYFVSGGVIRLITST